jgi:hypothetical protein
MDTIGDAGRNGEDEFDKENEVDETNEELEDNDLPILPEGTPSDGPAPLA